MTPQPGKQTIVIQEVISQKIGNQTMIRQLIGYNMRNIFLENSYTKSGGETIPRPFSKKSRSSMFLDQ